MTRGEFIDKYRALIRVYFNFEELKDKSSIIIKEGIRPLNEFLNFYVPRYAKEGMWNDQPIEQILHDRDSILVQLKDVIDAPESWDLIPFQNADELRYKLWPIPIATDSESGRTLILDSNHTICTLLVNKVDIDVPYCELVGKDISGLGADLLLMNN